MDYVNLIASKATVGSLKRWTNRASIDPAEIIDEAQKYIYSRLRAPEMRTTIIGTMVLGTNAFTAPTDLVAPIIWTITTAGYFGEVELKDQKEVERRFNYNSSGVLVNSKPLVYYQRGAFTVAAPTFQMDSPADRAYTTRLLYYARPFLLSTGTATNFLTDKYPRLFRRAMLAIAQEFLTKSETERLYWEKLAEDEIITINALTEMNQGEGVPATTSDG